MAVKYSITQEVFEVQKRQTLFLESFKQKKCKGLSVVFLGRRKVAEKSGRKKEVGDYTKRQSLRDVTEVEIYFYFYSESRHGLMN